MPAIDQTVINPDAAVASEPGDVNVLVTGYGPFLDDIPINPSWSIASTLPKSLAPTATCPYHIKLHVPPEPLKVAYASVIEADPKLLNPDPESGVPKPDFILHIGLAAGRHFYTLERQAEGGEYNHPRCPDVDGRQLAVEDRERLFKGCPRILRPTFNTEDLWRRWRENVKDEKVDLRPSNDPGLFLCGFIYYLSMAWFYKQGKDVERPVIFLHVPELKTEEEVEEGRQVAIGLLRSMVASRKKLGKRDPLQENDDEEFGLDEKERWSGVRA